MDEKAVGGAESRSARRSRLIDKGSIDGQTGGLTGTNRLTGGWGMGQREDFDGTDPRVAPHVIAEWRREVPAGKTTPQRKPQGDRVLGRVSGAGESGG